MSRIDKLIAELCPDGVEFKELGEISNVETGQQLNKNKLTDNGSFPVLNGGIGYSGFYNEYNTKENTLAISQGGASAGYVNFMSCKFWAGAHCYTVIPTTDVIDNKFLYYNLKNRQIQLQNLKRGAGIPGLNRSELKKFTIPFPPLPIQQEIVRILDNFTDLDAELQAELEARKKQYEYYRDQLLNFEEKDVEWKTLGEICDVRDGTHDSPKKSLEGMFLVTSKNIKNNRIDLTSSYLISEYDYNLVNKRSKVDKWDILISMIGTVGEVAIINTEPNFAIKNVGLIKVANELLSKYIAYYLNGSYARSYITSTQNGSAQKFLSLTMLRKFPIPIPPLVEQERIVSILDKFEALVNEELPAEIAARRKQYEYYREKLLTFERAK